MSQTQSAGNYEDMARLMRALAHPVRLQILAALLQRPAYVCDLIAITGQRQAYVSQHLMVLRAVGLVESTQTHKHQRYRLSRPELGRVLRLAGVFCTKRPDHPDTSC